MWRHKRNAQRCNLRMTLAQIHVLWEKADTPNTICIGIVFSSPLWFRMKDKNYLLSIHYIVMTINMVNLTLSVLIGHSILRMMRWHLCRLSRRDHQWRWLAIFPNSLEKLTIIYVFSRSIFIDSIFNKGKYMLHSTSNSD